MSLIPRFLERGFEAMLEPLVRWLIAVRVRPNAITTVGTLILLGSAVAFGLGAIRLGGILVLLSGICDMLDGRVARGGSGTTKFGAFYDSTLDRIGESALYGGIAIFFVSGGVPGSWMLVALAATIVALAASLIVSYARARAEGLGLECKVGVGQRAERVLSLGLPTLFFGAGPDGFLLLAVTALLALMAVVTVIQRILHVRKITRVVRRATQARWVAPMLADMSSRKGRSGD
ncbi:MAG: CDP-alcohol phosphatidyltransferase family protein [Gemmatimonadales bacterium]|nr:CDP-alcohol phosphatidyltransferase family protein [Gemmatimonadales bacterium]NIN10962.1 CDP-alcohol phosphatidyltransferase family protein [Gemmatimonadales bacterium]NIN49555.1 CDP-alcohol phosphatidyltransferase family protein [Gemmatimonadales bacterium]NIP07019.1 CDP-alcohol phosphatidyltransferase family protein [Gemmatimonadales bacterium]NIR01652.1 CDP-alcohol phosphatidyltransferase family protein [Gemmatimonadales bacterium]